jgi:pimeloyl-ACP methyl ester carboxylesterase
MGHRPFLVIADYLTRRGIAVLRVDDRGIGGSTGDVAHATTADFAGDTLAGVAYLKTRKEIDPKRIGLIGHSEGGVIAPMCAARSKDVAFIVMLAGTGLPGEEILYRQGALILKAMGADPEMIAQQRRAQERLFAVLKREKDDKVAEKEMRKIYAELLVHPGPDPAKAAAGAKTEPEKPAESLPAGQEASLQALLTPWFRYFLTYDPRPALKQVKCPVLAINGAKDLQVPPKEDLREIAAALKAGGNRHYTVRELPGLNHLFQTARTGAPAEYGQIEETFSPTALRVVGDWIVQRTDGAAKKPV